MALRLHWQEYIYQIIPRHTEISLDRRRQDDSLTSLLTPPHLHRGLPARGLPVWRSRAQSGRAHAPGGLGGPRAPDGARLAPQAGGAPGGAPGPAAVTSPGLSVAARRPRSGSGGLAGRRGASDGAGSRPSPSPSRRLSRRSPRGRPGAPTAGDAGQRAVRCPAPAAGLERCRQPGLRARGWRPSWRRSSRPRRARATRGGCAARCPRPGLGPAWPSPSRGRSPPDPRPFPTRRRPGLLSTPRACRLGSGGETRGLDGGAPDSQRPSGKAVRALAPRRGPGVRPTGRSSPTA